MNYDDIININYEAIKKSRMSLKERSAQFAPFQALDGYSYSVYEAERLTKERIILDDDKKELLNEKIFVLYTNKQEGIFTYFKKDTRKDGGSYKKIKGIIKKIDDIYGYIIFEDKTKLKIDDIVNIE